MKMHSCFFTLLLLVLLVNGEETTRSQGGKHVLCFVDGAAALKEHPEARFLPEDLDLTICTHVVYEQAIISRDLEIVPKDRTVDLQGDEGLGLFNRTVELKKRKPGLEVYITVYDGAHGELERNLMIGNNSAMATFTENAVEFIKTYGFDGMNIQINTVLADEPPAQGYDHFLPIIHEEFQRHGIKLTATLMPIEHPNEVPFEMTEPLSRYLDLVVVASYWKLSKEITAILSSTREMERIVDGFKDAGVPPEKLLVAIPAFSISVKLCDFGVYDVGKPVCGEGDEGTFAPETKMILYSSELLKKMANTSEEWSITKDPKSKMLFAESKSLLWTSYEDYTSIRTKAAFVVDKNLGGVAIVKSNMEDFKGLYTGDGETFPITRNAYKRMHEES